MTEKSELYAVMPYYYRFHTYKERISISDSFAKIYVPYYSTEVLSNLNFIIVCFNLYIYFFVFLVLFFEIIAFSLVILSCILYDLKKKYSKYKEKV